MQLLWLFRCQYLVRGKQIFDLGYWFSGDRGKRCYGPDIRYWAVLGHIHNLLCSDLRLRFIDIIVLALVTFFS
ncbi:hypothetical protein V6N12_006736 [Hibiscus sabdariffa]|uniref:Uncharacterized protein n=1 Tax=Hibiscus sabdariffa TaxID=183260 RepID=A0ABR2EZN7_9ROSI